MVAVVVSVPVVLVVVSIVVVAVPHGRRDALLLFVDLLRHHFHDSKRFPLLRDSFCSLSPIHLETPLWVCVISTGAAHHVPLRRARGSAVAEVL